MGSVPAENPAQLAVRDALGRQYGELLAIVRWLGRGKVEAEEVLQIALMRVLERAEQLRDPKRADAWVARVVRNVLIDELRRGNEPVLSVDDNLAGIEDGGIDCWCVLVQAEQLKPEYAGTLRRVVVEGASVTDVATELGLTPNNAMVRLHRARKALKERLRSHCGTTTARACADCGCEERGCCLRPFQMGAEAG